MKEKCFDCGHELRWRHRYTVDDSYVGKITVHGKYLHCPNCGSDEVPYETLKMVENVRKDRAVKLLWIRAESPVEFEKQYVRSKEAAAILGVTCQTIAQSKAIRKYIINLSIGGIRYWLKESVERYRETGNGWFPLIVQNDHASS
ncbi:MAG: hypothetical protein IKX30_04775 [Victivallales bacterium]|nr:hypothetical protein [Victivallales bacterium]